MSGIVWNSRDNNMTGITELKQVKTYRVYDLGVQKFMFPIQNK